MTPDYMDLAEVRGSRGYQKLQALWAEQGLKIMENLNKQSKLTGKDTSLRYYAGQWNGFDLAVGMLERALEDIQRKLGNERESTKVDDILSKLNDRTGETNK